MVYWLEFAINDPNRPTGTILAQPKLPTEGEMERRGLIYRRLFAKGKDSNKTLAEKFGIRVPADAE